MQRQTRDNSWSRAVRHGLNGFDDPLKSPYCRRLMAAAVTFVLGKQRLWSRFPRALPDPREYPSPPRPCNRRRLSPIQATATVVTNSGTYLSSTRWPCGVTVNSQRSAVGLPWSTHHR